MKKQIFVFRGTYGKKPRIYILPAKDEDEAWRLFAHKYAIGNFGLSRKTTLKDMKSYFHDTVEVIGPEEVYEFDDTPIMTTEKLAELRKVIDTGKTENEALDIIGLSILRDK